MELAARQAQAKADMRLVNRIRSTDSSEEDFRALYERYAGATFSFFMRKVGNPDSAADLNQELFIRLSKSISNFEGRCSWRTWVFLIARTVLAEARAHRWQRLSERSVQIEPEMLSKEFHIQEDADDRAVSVLIRERLQICIKRLDEIARAVVIGHYFDGVTLREMTDRLELENRSGSRGVLISAQRKLKQCLTRGDEQ